MGTLERLAAVVGLGTSLAGLVIALLELPSDPSVFNLQLAVFASLTIIALLLFYYLVLGNKESTRRKRQASPSVTRSLTPEEKHLRSEFPAIFEFLDSIGRIRDEHDFDEFVDQLNRLLEIEKRSRGIKWSEVKEIETMKAIAYAKLVGKKDNSHTNTTQ